MEMVLTVSSVYSANVIFTPHCRLYVNYFWCIRIVITSVPLLSLIKVLLLLYVCNILVLTLTNRNNVQYYLGMNYE